MGYFPFAFGGNVHAPMITEIDVIEERELSKGINAFSFKTPKGNIRIAESLTGAIVGDSFEDVSEDIRTGDDDIIIKQLLDAAKVLKGGNSKWMKNEEFFKMYKY